MLDPPDGPDGCEEAAGEGDAGEDENWLFPGGNGGRGFVHGGVLRRDVAIQHG